MLVLSRKPLEQIQIGESIVVTVVRVEGGAVRLGIEAPSEVRVFRSELLPHTALKRGARAPVPSRCEEFAENSV